MDELFAIIRDIFIPESDIVNLLRRAHVLAFTYGHKELAQWTQHELNGYSETEQVPDYRVLEGSLKAFNPSIGWIDILVSDDNRRKELCTLTVRDSIPFLLSYINDNPLIFNSLSGNEQVVLNRESGMPYTMEYAVHFTKAAINDIFEKVRTRLSEQLVMINTQKISGRGMEQADKNSQEDDLKNSIFISHRSLDVDIADMLLDFFKGVGIPSECVFCSSLPGNDVNEKVSPEVKSALQTSQINIAILSRDYYKSAYCLNEAGIIWFLDKIPAVPIALPEITHDKMYGFLDKDYKAMRLDNSDDIAHIYERIILGLGIPQTGPRTLTRETNKLIKKYNEFLAKRTCAE